MNKNLNRNRGVFTNLLNLRLRLKQVNSYTKTSGEKNTLGRKTLDFLVTIPKSLVEEFLNSKTRGLLYSPVTG